MDFNQQDTLVTLSVSVQLLLSTRYRLQQMSAAYRKIFSEGWRQWATVKEDLVRGGGGPVPPARERLPGGFYIISVEHGFWDIYSQQRTGKKGVQGIPCHSWSSTGRIVESHHSARWCMQHSRRLGDTFFQTAEDGSFSALLLPKAVHAK